MSKGRRAHKESRGERRSSRPSGRPPDALLVAMGKGMYAQIKPPAPQARVRERVNRG